MWEQLEEVFEPGSLSYDRTFEGYHRNRIHGEDGRTLSFRSAAAWSLPTPRGYADIAVVSRQLAWALEWAAEQDVRVRAVGSLWSFSECGAPGTSLDNDTRTLLVDTRAFEKAVVIDAGPCWYVTSGTQLHGLNHELEAKGYSLPTSGSSDGQTIGGAIGTGVHGSAIDVGAIHQAVRAFHMATPAGQVLVFRHADKILGDRVSMLLDIPKIVVDSDLFDAISVSFGSFGIMIGVIIEASRRYTLRVVRVSVPLKEALAEIVRQIRIDDFDLSSIDERLRPSLETSARPHHVQIIFHPRAARGLCVAMYPRDGAVDHEPFTWPSTMGSGAKRFVQFVWYWLSALDPFYELFTKDGFLGQSELDVWGDRSEVFGEPKANDFPMHSFALGVALEDIEELVSLSREVHQTFPGTCEVRFAKSSPALLAINRFGPVSAILGVDGLDQPDTWAYTKALLEATRDAGIEHTFHWGKMTHLSRNNSAANRKILDSMYGTRLQAWSAARAKFLGPDGVRVFDNVFLRRLGL